MPDSNGVNFGTYHALLIGISNYAPWPQLSTPVADAEALEQVLRVDYGFTTTILRNATREEIFDALGAFQALLSENDNLLVFFAGHGQMRNQKGYWIPVNGDTKSPARWVSNEDIKSELELIRAKHVMVIADSCFSGTLTRGFSTQAPGPNFYQRLASRPVRLALSSGGKEPVEDNGGAGHSIFATYLIQELRQNLGVLQAANLYTSLRDLVATHSEQTPYLGTLQNQLEDPGDFLFVRPQEARVQLSATPVPTFEQKAVTPLPKQEQSGQPATTPSDTSSPSSSPATTPTPSTVPAPSGKQS